MICTQLCFGAASGSFKFGTRLDGFVTDVEFPFPEDHTFLSYAERVAACSFQISEGVDDQRLSCFTHPRLTWSEIKETN